MTHQIASRRRRIYLMRHGQVDFFDADGTAIPSPQRPLSETGRRQARAAGKLLADAGVMADRVISSTLPRTVESARCVLDEMRCTARIEAWPQLCEIAAGPLAQIAAADLEHEFRTAFQGVVAEDTRYLRGERFGSLIDRVHGALQLLQADSTWDTLLMVLHGGVNRAILSHALTGSRMYLGNFQQAPGCINVLDVDQSWIVRAVNINAMDLAHARTRATTMEEAYQQYSQGSHESQ